MVYCVSYIRIFCFEFRRIEIDLVFSLLRQGFFEFMKWVSFRLLNNKIIQNEVFLLCKIIFLVL